MKLRGFFAIVFAFLFTVEVYSSHFSYREPLEGVDDGCKYDGRYMRINVNECHENNNSQMECPAMADSETSSDSRTDFTLERPKENELSKLRCISFNNTYSLMVQGNNVSFVNVSCEKENKNVWFKFKRLDSGRHHGFFIRGSTMCLTRNCDGTLSLEKVNSTDHRNCFFRQKN